MNAALCALHEVVARSPQPYKNLIPSFVSILKQVRVSFGKTVSWQLGFVGPACPGRLHVC